MRELDDFIKLAQQRAMKDLWDNDYDIRFDDYLGWTQKFVFNYTNETKEETKILSERMLAIGKHLSSLKDLHTEITGHTKFSLLKTSEMSKELIMTFYYECLEC